MAETESSKPESAPARSADEVALELTKFIAVTTGYGKASQASAGFSGKPATLSAEEYAEALLDLFVRCRRVVNNEPK